MLNRELITRMMSLNEEDLERILIRSGYMTSSFKNAQFIGLTDTGHFSYKVTYCDEEKEFDLDVNAFVYVRYDKTLRAMTAEI